MILGSNQVWSFKKNAVGEPYQIEDLYLITNAESYLK
jgi:hypothetical protein